MKRIEDFIIKGYHWLNYKNYLIELESQQEIPEISPGNFAELAIPDSSSIFLRRPFSIFDVDYDRNVITFYIKVVGKGTQILGNSRIGGKVNMVYPLGNAFSVPGSKRILIVAGGSGLAPFLLLSRKLKERQNHITYLFGARDSDGIVLTEHFKPLGHLNITTEDGSIGEKGLVTEHSLFKAEKLPFDLIYCCGPEPMMHAVAKIARQAGIPCEVSLENIMGCGIGVCLSCVVETHEGNKCVCTEGPVFNVNELKW